VLAIFHMYLQCGKLSNHITN